MYVAFTQYNVHLLKTICESWEDNLLKAKQTILEIVPRHYLNSEPCLRWTYIPHLWHRSDLIASYFSPTTKTAYNAHLLCMIIPARVTAILKVRDYFEFNVLVI